MQMSPEVRKWVIYPTSAQATHFYLKFEILPHIDVLRSIMLFTRRPNFSKGVELVNVAGRAFSSPRGRRHLFIGYNTELMYTLPNRFYTGEVLLLNAPNLRIDCRYCTGGFCSTKLLDCFNL